MTDINFAELLERHKGILHKISGAYCYNTEDRKDLMQDIAVQVWRSLPRYNPQYKITTWIYRIALNVAISWYRKNKPFLHQTVELTDSLQIIDPTSTKDQEMSILQLHQFIQGLKELDKALMLLYLEETSYTEMAEILGISLTNVSTKISRIKKQLQHKFSTINHET